MIGEARRMARLTPRCQLMTDLLLRLSRIALARFSKPPGLPSVCARDSVPVCYNPVNFGSPAVHLTNILI